MPDGDGVPEPLYYNGWRAGSDVVAPDRETGAARTLRLGVDTMARAGLQGRGVSSICVTTLAMAGAWLAMTISCGYSRRTDRGGAGRPGLPLFRLR